MQLGLQHLTHLCMSQPNTQLSRVGTESGPTGVAIRAVSASACVCRSVQPFAHSVLDWVAAGHDAGVDHRALLSQHVAWQWNAGGHSAAAFSSERVRLCALVVRACVRAFASLFAWF
jgi:hypothetical protein